MRWKKELDTLTKTINEKSQQLTEKDIENTSLRKELDSIKQSFEKEKEQILLPLENRLDQFKENAKQKCPQN